VLGARALSFSHFAHKSDLMATELEGKAFIFLLLLSITYAKFVFNFSFFKALAYLAIS